MIRLIATRLLAAIPTLLAVIALSFFLLRLAPGGPFDAERALDPAIRANLERLYGLDRPLPLQFATYLGALLHGDLGPSLHWRDFTVVELFARALPISLQLGGEALVAAIVGGVALGAVAARSGAWAIAAGTFALLGLAVPSFVLAPLLQVFFGLDLRWLPVGGWEDGAWRHQVLPVAVLALPQIAIVAKLTQSALRESRAAPHIRTLRAFGLPSPHVAVHVLRGAALPILSYLGPAAAALLTGSVVVETVFGIPGIGRYFVDSALSRDYPLTMCTVIVIGAAIVLLNLLVDIAFGLVDPRVRHD